MAAIFVYSLARGEDTEHYKIKQPIRQKSPLFVPSVFPALLHCPKGLKTEAWVRDCWKLENSLFYQFPVPTALHPILAK